MDKFVGWLIVFAFIMAVGLAIAVPVNLLQGKILYDLWGWFVQPVFNVELTYLGACGLMIVFSLLVIVPTVRGYEQDSVEYWTAVFLRPVLTPLTIWALGAIMKFWVF